MTDVLCPHCGQSHELSRIEPSFLRPDAFVAIPVTDRATRARDTDEGCLIASEDGQTLRAFLRAILRVPILGDPHGIGWGIWVELAPAEYFRLVGHADDPLQGQVAPSDGALANQIPANPGTLGLPGSLQLTGVTTRPVFTFAPAVTHSFAREAREGVRPERAMEWRFRAVHPPTA